MSSPEFTRWAKAGIAASQRADWVEAEKSFLAALELDHSTAVLWMLLSSTLRNLGEHEEAAHAARQSLVLDPENAVAHVHLALAYKQLGRFVEAEARYRRAAELLPEEAAPWVGLGIVLSTRGRAADAESAFRQALTLDPKHAEAMYNLAMLVWERDAAEARRLLEAALQAAPESAQLWHGMGYLEWRGGDLDAAEKHLLRALGLDAGQPRFHYTLAGVLNAQGRSALARTVALRARRLEGRRGGGEKAKTDKRAR